MKKNDIYNKMHMFFLKTCAFCNNMSLIGHLVGYFSMLTSSTSKIRVE